MLVHACAQAVLIASFAPIRAQSNPAPVWTTEGDQQSEVLGSVASAGDVNDDGYDDVLVGAHGHQLGEGRVSLFQGSASGLEATAAWQAESNDAYAHFGAALGSAGDVNGDGFSDVIVGAPGVNGSNGRAYVYLGSALGLSGTPSWTAEGVPAGNINPNLGSAVGTAGDVNGDGYADVIVGAPGYNVGGRAYVYHGSSLGLSSIAAWTFDGEQPWDGLGTAVGSAGDVNGDGFGDVIVGSPWNGSGRVYVFAGSAAGLSTGAAWVIDGAQEGSGFGLSAGTAGDVNGDGFSDIVVGAPWYDWTIGFYGGRVFAFLGSPTGLSAAPNWVSHSEYLCGATAGDVNKDGYDDVIVGSDGILNNDPNQNLGRVAIHLGTGNGLSLDPAWTVTGDQFNSGFGHRYVLNYGFSGISTAGDVNGDGLPDIVVGAQGYDAGQEDEGKAFLYYLPFRPSEKPAVLFLHGVMASLLYQGPEQSTVWPTVFNDDLRALDLACPKDVYPITAEVLRSVAFFDVYGGFQDFMHGPVAQRVIGDWGAYTYDWRHDWRDIVRNGTVYSARCFVPRGPCPDGEGVSSLQDCNACGLCLWPADQVAALVGNSSRNVWIVAHSNGGLLAKTLLGEPDPARGGLLPETAAHVGGLILVASPQLGTPKAFSPLLHGEEYAKVFASHDVLRTAVHEMPGAYQLLPSRRYFDRVLSPVIEFVRSPTGGLEIDDWIAEYGTAIANFGDMKEFLLATGGPRMQNPSSVRIDWPAILDAATFGQSETAHDDIARKFDLQARTFPVYQIVGWGLSTTRGLRYRSKDLRGSFFETIRTCDGDGTVVVPSAAALAGPRITTYYVNLHEYNRRRGENRSHGDILGVDVVQLLISRILEGNPRIDDLEFVSTTQPTDPCSDRKDGYLITRSPVEIHLFQAGWHTGPVEMSDEGVPKVEDGIPNSQYTSLAEGREVIVDGLGTYATRIEATATGTVTLEGGRLEGDLRREVFRVPEVPIRTGSRIEFSFEPAAETPPPMTMDIDSDGTPEFVLSAGAPPGPPVFLAVIGSAVDLLDEHTRAAGLPASLEQQLRKDLDEVRKDLVRATAELDRNRPHGARLRLEHAIKGLRHDYGKRLSREVEHGSVTSDTGGALLDEEGDVAELVDLLIEQIPD
jgi:hypothetical protein